MTVPRYYEDLTVIDEADLEAHMGVILKRPCHGQKSLIPAASPNTKVQDTVIMTARIILKIWISTAGCIRHWKKLRNIWKKMEARPFCW